MYMQLKQWTQAVLPPHVLSHQAPASSMGRPLAQALQENMNSQATQNAIAIVRLC